MQSTGWSRRAPFLVFAAVQLFALVFWLNAGRLEWFYLDEWDFLAQRKATNLGDLFRPHNEHWTTVPILFYRALYFFFGLREYFPYRLVVVVFYLVGAALLYVVILRGGSAPVDRDRGRVALHALRRRVGKRDQAVPDDVHGCRRVRVRAVAALRPRRAVRPPRRAGHGRGARRAHVLGHRDHDGVRGRAGSAVASRLAERAAARGAVGGRLRGVVARGRSRRQGAPARRAAPADGGIGRGLRRDGIAGSVQRARALRRPGCGARARARGRACRSREASDFGRAGRRSWPRRSRCWWERWCSWPSTAIGRSSFGSDYARISRYISLTAAMVLPALAVAVDALARRWRFLLPIGIVLLLVGIPSNLREVAVAAATLGLALLQDPAHDPDAAARRRSPRRHPDRCARNS